MAFKLAPKETIKMSVSVFEQQDDDIVEESKISVTYKRLKKSDFKKMVQRISDSKDQYEWSDVLREHVKDVSPLVDADGKEIKFSQTVMDELLDYLPTFDAILLGFTQLNTGAKEAERRKNS